MAGVASAILTLLEKDIYFSRSGYYVEIALTLRTRRFCITMTTESSLSILRAFLDQVEAEMEWEFDIGNFDDRLRLQKFVHLASAFGFDHPYTYGLYLRGPYSPSLAQDYYSDMNTVSANTEALQTFDVGGFVDLVQQRDIRWLEVAATLQAYQERLQQRGQTDQLREKAVQRTSEEKDEPIAFVESVYDDLARADALSDD